eukprot:scaffold3151_cov110-Cylindrotheca_fusiformis.AAC.5
MSERVDRVTDERTPRIHSDQAVITLVIQRNNMAVSMIRRRQLGEAKALLKLALIGLQNQVQDVPTSYRSHTNNTTVSPQINDDEQDDGSNCPSVDEVAATLDEWMATPQNQGNHDDDISREAFFIYGEGINIPLPAPSEIQTSDSDVSYKAIAFAIFFNKGLAYQLSSKRMPSESQSRQVADIAKRLYILAFQYRYQEQSTKGTFLLAVCNNLAVLDRQWDDDHAARTIDISEPNHIGPYFEHLRELLRRFAPSPSSTPDEVALWRLFSENLHRAVFFDSMTQCAGAG